MEFSVTLIKATSAPNEMAMSSLTGNCIYVKDNYWIMEGDVDALRDDGVVCEEIAEGIVGSLGDMNQSELLKQCKYSFGVVL